MKHGNINLINHVMKVIHCSGYKIDQVMMIDLYEVIFVNILLVFLIEKLVVQSLLLVHITMSNSLCMLGCGDSIINMNAL